MQYLVVHEGTGTYIALSECTLIGLVDTDSTTVNDDDINSLIAAAKVKIELEEVVDFGKLIAMLHDPANGGQL